MVVLNFYYRLPGKLCWVSNNLHFGRRTAIENNVEPVVLLKALSCLEFVCSQGNLAHFGATLNLDEANFNCRLRVLRMRTPRNKVESAIFGFDALNLSTLCTLVGNYRVYRKALNFVVAHKRRHLRRQALRVRQ